MLFHCRAVLPGTLLLSLKTLAQFIPSATDLIAVNSTVSDGAQVQYKEVSICESTEGVRSFSGYIHLPVDSLHNVGLDQNRPINTFFWFVESRKNREKAPLTLYLNGGPGAPSTSSLLRENGPCRVNLDSRTTHLNPWSWNAESHIIYIDQPVNTGFSYDLPANGTIDFRGEKKLCDASPAAIVKDSRLIQAATVGRGSIDSEFVVNSTESAVRAIWLCLAIWLQDFPERPSHGHEVALWTASYGGHYAPALYDFTMLQNRAIKENNSAVAQAPRIRFSSIGLANACVDSVTQLPAYLEMAFNNTYGLQLINQSTYFSGKRAWDGPVGCKAQIRQCRSHVAGSSSQYLENNVSTNTICRNANAFCGKYIANLVSPSGRSFFDIGHRSHFLTEPTLLTYLGYLRRANVQAALGVAVNFTDQAIHIAHAFSTTGDNVQRDYMVSLGRALDDGVRVSLMYGDRDYACNWLGGEALSMAIPHKQASMFLRAGYAPVDGVEGDESRNKVPKAYVRQYGNLSFTRVLDSGHTINTIRPSIGFTIFNRTICGVDIASGRVTLRDEMDYSTAGPYSTWHIQNQLPADADEEEGMCYVLDLSHCSIRQQSAYLTGRARVKNYWLTDYGDGTCCANPVEPCEKNQDGWQGIGEHFETAFRGSPWLLALLITAPVMATASMFLAVVYARVKRSYQPVFDRKGPDEALGLECYSL